MSTTNSQDCARLGSVFDKAHSQDTSYSCCMQHVVLVACNMDGKKSPTPVTLPCVKRSRISHRIRVNPRQRHRLGRSHRLVLLAQAELVQFAVAEMRQVADEVDPLGTFGACDLRPTKHIQIDLVKVFSRPQYHDAFHH